MRCNARRPLPVHRRSQRTPATHRRSSRAPGSPSLIDVHDQVALIERCTGRQSNCRSHTAARIPSGLSTRGHCASGCRQPSCTSHRRDGTARAPHRNASPRSARSRTRPRATAPAAGADALSEPTLDALRSQPAYAATMHHIVSILTHHRHRVRSSPARLSVTVGELRREKPLLKQAKQAPAPCVPAISSAREHGRVRVWLLRLSARAERDRALLQAVEVGEPVRSGSWAASDSRFFAAFVSVVFASCRGCEMLRISPRSGA